MVIYFLAEELLIGQKYQSSGMENQMKLRGTSAESS